MSATTFPAVRDHVAEIRFDEARHRYTRGGIVLPSVTRVLRAMGMSPFGTSPPAVISPKMQVGTWIHDMMKLYFNGTLDSEKLSPPMRDILDVTMAWMKEQNLAAYVVEKPLAHSLFWYAGKPDVVCRDFPKDQIIVIDWKWGVPKPIDILQLGGYCEMVRDCYGFRQGEVIGIPVYIRDLLAGKEPRRIRGKEMENAIAVFLSAHACYKWRLAHGLISSEDEEGEDEDE